MRNDFEKSFKAYTQFKSKNKCFIVAKFLKTLKEVLIQPLTEQKSLHVDYSAQFVAQDFEYDDFGHGI